MKNLNLIVCGLSCFMAVQALADDNMSTANKVEISKSVRKSKSAAQRSAAGQIRRNFEFSQIGDDYAAFKNMLQQNYGLDFSFDISYMGQRGAPNGKKNAMQTIYYPSLTWNMFDNDYGNGTLNMSYSSVKYGGIQAQKLGSRLGAVTAINDYASPTYSFDEMYFAYRLGGHCEATS